MSDERISPAQLAALAELEKKATPADKLMIDRYDHGGGRCFVPGDDRLRGEGRKLVVDYYHEEDRELFHALRLAAPALLAEISHLTRERDEARADHAALVQEYGEMLALAGDVSNLNVTQISALRIERDALAKERDQAYLGIVNLQQACEALRRERDALRTSTQATPGTPGHEQAPA